MTRIEIEKILKQFKIEPDDGLVDELVYYVECARRDARHDAMMETMDKVRKALTGRRDV